MRCLTVYYSENNDEISINWSTFFRTNDRTTKLDVLKDVIFFLESIYEEALTFTESNKFPRVQCVSRLSDLVITPDLKIVDTSKGVENV